MAQTRIRQVPLPNRKKVLEMLSSSVGVGVMVSVGFGVLVEVAVFVAVGISVGISVAVIVGIDALFEELQLVASKQTRDRMKCILICINFPFAKL